MEEKIMEDNDVERDRQEDTMIGSPLSEGKMVIKLKIPMLAAAAMEGERSSEVIGSLSSKTAKEGKRVCSECKKEFSSGKALGGHMRVHVQSANRINTFLKPSKTTKFKKSNQDFNNGDHRENLKMKKEHQLQQQRKPNYKSCLNDEGNPKCSLCGKIFPSMKSLFGHMRCHPERLWRGIVPPPTTPTTPTTAASRRNLKSSSSGSSSSSLSENGLNVNYEEGSNILEDDDGGDQVVDLTKFLRGWTVTERRGRRALRAADEDEVLREAVEDLMSLANGDPSMAESDVTQKQLQVFEGTNSNSLTNKDHKIDEKSPSIDLPEKDGANKIGLTTEYAKEKAAMEEEIERKSVAKVEFEDGGMIKNFSDNESESRNTNEQMLISYKYKKNPQNNPTKTKKRKKMKLMMELGQGFSPEMVGPPPQPPLLLTSMASPQDQPESKYKCTTCNKSFTSHQALGGHRSSHNKSKITQIEEDDHDSSIMNQTCDNVEKEVEFAGDAMVAPATVNNSNSGLHQCKICAKIFPTGQALGGHKRCHWTGAIEAQAPSSQVTSTGEAASQTCGGRRKVLDFDLNEVPPAAMMEDESGTGNGGGNGNGYASSSYNSNMG